MSDEKRACEACKTTEHELRQIPATGVWVCKDVRACVDRIPGPEGIEWRRPADELHPTGRCTCGGEGNCQWCQRVCPVCLGDCMDTHCDACDSTGWAFLEPQAPDYEALGYQETEITEAVCGFEELAMGIDLYMGTMFGDAWERAQAIRDREKDIRDATDNG
ncbi:MAG: hypothetical protein EHM35_00965 [Planctomycetaceae bacterium]|nr:MAG: hypothetical protein EHM35_00965 [Planctomycetaceae bacterium]